MAKKENSSSKGTSKTVKIHKRSVVGDKVKAWQPTVDRTTTPPKKSSEDKKK
ncbi:hypothetical protein ACT3CD_16630 [Geofilum sp. OHC36d9]|uniref:hypothetical protein n=1 Tax=Geofilum sp. OHC36d9 TaxID=3458413 RepID=UPI0040334806